MELHEIIEGLKEKGYTNDQYPWMLENDQRRNRWKNYFGDRHDLKNDSMLKHFGVNEDARQTDMIRRQTEVLLDNFIEATTTTDIATFGKWALPLIRKIWPRLFAREIVSVQPMPGPTAQAFTMDWQYGSSGGAYASGTSIYNNPDYTYANDPGEGVEPRELKKKITGTTITSVAKKLKSVDSIEAIQDAMTQHGVNLQAEGLKAMQMEIEREINTELINDIYDSATTNTTWASAQPASPSPWANATPKEYAESLVDAISDANNQIFTRIYQRANFILAGPTFANRLSKMSNFRTINDNAGYATIVSGPNLFGVLKNQYRVYIDPFFSDDQAIVGHKSDNWLYSGYVHMPHVMFWVTPDIYSTAMQVSKGVMTRYGKYAKNGDFYATVTVV